MYKSLPPSEVAGPRLETLLSEHGLNFTTFAERVRTSRETIRKACLPWDDPKRTPMRRALRLRIIAYWAERGVSLAEADFFPPIEAAA